MKNIVIPTDFSETALHAAKYAIMLFRNSKVTFHLLHAYEVPNPPSGSLISMQDIIRQNSEEELLRTKKELEKMFEIYQPCLTTHSLLGPLTSAINEMAETQPIDLIIMGTTGASGLKEALLGSQAAAIINQISIPTLAVPAKAELNAPSAILLALADKELHLQEVKPLYEIIRQYNATLYVVHVKEGTDDLFDIHLFEPTIKNIFPFEKVIVEELIDNDKEEALLNFVNHFNVTLVCTLHKKKKNIIEKLFKKSFSRKLSMHTHIPMLSIPVGKRTNA